MDSAKNAFQALVSEVVRHIPYCHGRNPLAVYDYRRVVECEKGGRRINGGQQNVKIRGMYESI